VNECVHCAHHVDGADQLGPRRDIIGVIGHLRNDYDKDALHIDDATGAVSTMTNEAWLSREYQTEVRTIKECTVMSALNGGVYE
jgi:hypothetical protein